jgi:acyl-CoA thioesterase I
MQESNDVRPIIVAFGNSLTEGLGVDPAQNYPSRLQAKIDASGYRYRVVNSGISGETSVQGLNRIEEIVRLQPALAIVELGANDGLLGFPIEETRRNLAAIIRRLQSSGIEVILAGMQLPPDYDSRFAREFRDVFVSLAEEYRIPLIPFFLEGVGGRPELNQQDGLHPKAQGYGIIAENVWNVLQPLLKR